MKNQADGKRALSALTVKKNSSKTKARTAIRNAAKKLRANSSVTNQQLALLDLPVSDYILSGRNSRRIEQSEKRDDR